MTAASVSLFLPHGPSFTPLKVCGFAHSPLHPPALSPHAPASTLSILILPPLVAVQAILTGSCSLQGLFCFSVSESKLQVAVKESSVEVAGGADTSIECRILFSQNDSQLAVTWYFLPPPPADATPLQIVRASYSGLLEYGADFSSPAQRSRFLSQRVSSEAFQLRILSAGPGDQGGYRCLVEEWRWLEDGWRGLGEGQSGRTSLRLRLPGELGCPWGRLGLSAAGLRRSSGSCVGLFWGCSLC